MISSGLAIESIAKPAHAHQICGRRRILFDLPPQADDVVVDDAVGEERAGAPGLVEQLIAAEYTATVADEGRQQLEFGRRDVDGRAAPPQLTTACVNFHISEAVDLHRFRRRMATKRRADSRPQLFRTER